MAFGTQQTAWNLLVHVIANGITNAGIVNDARAVRQIVEDFLRDLQQQNIIVGYSTRLDTQQSPQPTITRTELRINVTFPGDQSTYAERFLLSPTQQTSPPAGYPPPTVPGSSTGNPTGNQNPPKPSNPKDDAYDRAMRGI